MSQEVLAEVQGPLVFRIIYDRELDYLYCHIPIDKRITRNVVREISNITHDPWRYVEGLGLVLDLSAWASENGVDPRALGKMYEAKYREILDSVKKILDEAKETAGERKRKKKRTKRRSKRKKSKRGSRKKNRKSKK